MRLYTRDSSGEFTEETMDDDTVAFFGSILHNKERKDTNVSRFKRLLELENRDKNTRQPIQTTVTATT